MGHEAIVNAAVCATVTSVPFALVGLGFGGLAGWLAARTGKTAGGRLGRAVARGLEDRPAAATAVACAVDGALFLGTVGFLVGALGGWEVIPYAVVGLLALASSATVFGGYAYLLIQRRRPALAAVCGAMVGGAAGAVAGLEDPRWVVLGALAGVLLVVARCRNSSVHSHSVEVSDSSDGP